MKSLLAPALRLFIALSLLTGIAYPVVVYSIGQGLFPDEANGSLIAFREKTGREKIIGSTLIGQPFDAPQYFWSRPSATSPAYNAAASSGSNLGPLNPALKDAVQQRIAVLKATDPQNTKAIPVDLVTASASGLDPHISPAAAYYQLDRVARARRLPAEQIRALIEQTTESRQWALFGEPRVNVLQLNIALDNLQTANDKSNGLTANP